MTKTIAPQPLHAPSARLKILFPILLALITIAAYSNSLSGEFVLDDKINITANPLIHSLIPTYRTLVGPPRNTLTGRPLATLVFALNYQLSGLNVFGYHVINLAIHLLAALTLWGIMRRTLELPKLRTTFGDASPWLATAIALLWAVHPLNTAAVSYISQRVESLMGLFYLLTLYCFIRGATENPAPNASVTAAGGSPRSSRWFMLSIIACALGMLTKETMASAPVFVLLYDRLLLSEPIAKRRWFYIGLAATWLPLAGLTLLQPHSDTVGFAFPNFSSLDNLKTQSHAIVLYLKLALWPQQLVAYYGHANENVAVLRTFPQYAPWAAIVLILLALTILAFAKRNPLALPGIWFFFILAPSSSIFAMPTEVIAEHRMYLPLIAVSVIVVLGVYLLIKSRRSAMMAAIVLTMVTATLAGATYQRNKTFHTLLAMWSDVAAKQPMNTDARTVLGAMLIHAGRIRDGLQQFDDELNFSSDKIYIHRIIAEEVMWYGMWSLAQQHLREAVALGTNNPTIYNNLAWTEATNPDATMRSGTLAVVHALRAIELSHQRFPSFLGTLAAAYAENGQYDLAVSTQEEANRLSPDGDPKLQRLALYRSGKAYREMADVPLPR
jgi:tetratricopeptide (TPR) repeat protein